MINSQAPLLIISFRPDKTWTTTRKGKEGE